MIPKFDELIHPLLKLLSEEAHSRKTAAQKLLPCFDLTDDEKQERISSGPPKFENRVGWAFTFLAKAEYIELTEKKAFYRATNLGKDALIASADRKLSIDVPYLKEHSINYAQNWQVSKNHSKQNNSEIENVENNAIFNLEEELAKVDDEFKSNLLKKIKEMNWQDFEDLCAVLLEKMGYGIASKRVIRTGDGGIDGEIFEDELGLKGKIYIQAKKWDNNNVQPKDMKEFLYNVRGNKGVFITTSDFSDKARREAESYKEGKVALINYSDLIKLCMKYQVLCEKQALEIYKLN